ncbi:hypothetical protein AK830_g6699 [Neonectria ditissima]|uniref:N-acetyltransferase domain-containing protein n=1 Tax=Neonectria ditissima TaxID=78410 RepID=A0A0P7AZI3_9HYPO|nr:hypothetical protein AK830_g6699 [Neonectria ditissima]
MSSNNLVRLIPWDPNSSKHVDMLLQQREDCGWDSEKIPLWQEMQISGLKCIFWIEKAPLQDTSASIRGISRRPTQEQFYPVGHISLDSINPGTDVFNLDLPSKGVYWIKTFYVSKALRSKGIGRASMDVVESMAVDKPLCARTLALDTVHKDTGIALAIAATGEPPKMTNQGWYERRGYKLIKVVKDFYKASPEEIARSAPELFTVFLKKDIA